EPAQRIFFVIQRHRFFRQLERMLRIEHDRQFLRPRRVLTRHDRSRMRPVWDSTRMQRNRAALNSTPRPEIAPHIKENFVGLDVVVDPRDFYGFRMCIEEAWCERANNISANLEGL